MKDMTRPMIQQIEEVVKDVPGWSPIDQLYTLFNVAYLNSELSGDIVEIGSWGGRSASVLGLAARAIGGTTVHCIDLFPEKSDWKQNSDGSYSMEVQIGDTMFGGYKDQTVWKETFETQTGKIYEKYNSVFDCFMETIVRNQLQDIVKPFRGTAETFARSADPNFRCKLVFLDGDHSYDAVCTDIRTIEPFLVAGGWICFDDAFSSYEGVNRAINDLIVASPNYRLCQQMTRKFFIAQKRTSGTR